MVLIYLTFKMIYITRENFLLQFPGFCQTNKAANTLFVSIKSNPTQPKLYTIRKMLRSVFRAVPNVLRASSARATFAPVTSTFVSSPIRFYSSSLGKEEVTTRIIDVVKAFDKTTASADVTATTQFSKDLGLDSLDTVELLVAIEEEFDVEIPDKVADEIKSVGEAIDYITSNPEAN